jgi:hypothetical protein
MNTIVAVREGARSSRGSISVELACGSLLVSVFVIVALHLGVAIFGAFINDRACRDACRNAAQGETPTEASQLVNVMLNAYQATGFVSNPTLSAPIVYQDFGGTPPAQTSPYVQVTTSTLVTMPLQAFAFFGSGFLQDGKLTFTKTYTFPIVRVK